MTPGPVVFVIEDDRAVLESTAALINSVGLAAATFESAEAFLEQLQPDQTGCLLLDLRLPGIGGIELANILQAKEVDLPVILISGHASAELCSETITPNVVAHLEKPLDAHELIAIIRNVMSRD